MGAAAGYTVLVDGYNIIKRHGAWARIPLGEARLRLVELLNRTRWPHVPSRIVLVFDGQSSGALLPKPSHNLHVHFAAPSADAYIQQAIRTSATPMRLLVISDDGEILRTAKSHGVQRASSDWLFAHSRPAPQRTDDPPDKTALPASTARRITEELAQRWLKQ